MEADWKSIEIEYVTANPAVGYRKLADKYGVNLSTIGRHGSAEGWNSKREEHRERVAHDAQTEIAAQQADWCVEAIEQVDELLGVLRDGVYQLTCRAQISDVDKLIRLKAFLLGEPDSRQEVSHNGSIDTGSGNLGEVLRILVEAGAVEAGVEGAPDASP